MAQQRKRLKTCENGHEFYKSSDCPVCPVCAAKEKPKTGFLSKLSAPARRALKSNGITSIEKLAESTEKEILQLHGMGPASLPQLREALAEAGLHFKG